MSALFVVSTPIGNIEDISLRAIKVLKNCHLIAAEDTRVTRKILNYYDIKTPLTSYHRYNEEEKSNFIIKKMLEEDIDIALVTDAGTPAISDPGTILIKKAIKNNLDVIPIPGASAITTALSVSGFNLKEFAFFGFVSRKDKEQKKQLKDMLNRTPAGIIFESPKRIQKLLSSFCEIAPSLKIALFNDLTKMHERIYRGIPEEVYEQIIANENHEKGEYVLIFSQEESKLKDKKSVENEHRQMDTFTIDEQLFSLIYNKNSIRTGMKILEGRGYSRNETYAASIRLKNFLLEYAHIEDEKR